MFKNIHSLTEKISLALYFVFIFLFPLIVSPNTTDFYSIPKQIVLICFVFLQLILFGIKSIQEGTLKIRRTPFDLPIILFVFFSLLSSVFATNKADAIINVIPLLFSALLYFLTVNQLRVKEIVIIFMVILIGSAASVSLISILSYFKIYAFSLAGTQTQMLSTFGSMLDQAIFLAVTLSLSFFYIYGKTILAKDTLKTILFDWKTMTILFSFLFIVIGFILTLTQLFTTQKPIILPFQTGFQTAFATISQDNQNIIKGFLLGSGYGTYYTDFTRFKQPDFNQNNDIWSFSFFRSSSFLLELLATTGILGFTTFVFLLTRLFKEIKPLISNKNKKETENTIVLPGGINPSMSGVILIGIASILIPFSPTLSTIFFISLALFSVLRGFYEDTASTNKYYDIELYLVTFKKGVFAFQSTSDDRKHGQRGRLLPVSFFVFVTIIGGVIGFYTYFYIASDILFQSSINSASKNLGSQTYDLQNKAIAMFPFRDGYHRIFSQTNLAIASFLAEQQQKNPTNTTENQQTIYRLIQQSIEAGRNASAVSPQTALNWENLASVYRSLIGFGQNAENFAIVANQQAIQLDPNNPQQYINLGGIYYQIGQWDNAQRQFQIAVSLKPDFPNAYYNLGHALESKGDLTGAITQYNAVKTLVQNDATNKTKIEAEILALEKRIESGKTEEQAAVSGKTDKLEINSPATKLPEKKPPVEIPPPTKATESGTTQ